VRNNYTLENIQRAVRNPNLFIREGVRLLSLPIHAGYGRYVEYSNPEGVDVMAEDWDNLVILDACRYDYFEDQNTISGDLTRRISRGNKSWEFMQENFAGNQFHDTVYVTANPFVSRLDDVFYAVDTLDEYWDDDLGTIWPEDVVAAAVEANQAYPNKRIIVHFMQPHRPYLGGTADKLRERVDLVGYQNKGNGLQIWGAVKQGDVSVQEVRQAYSESLNIVLKEIEQLLSELEGKSVVTSDHGEMLGERVFPFTTRVWGHSEGFSTRRLRTVPWLSIEAEERREITADIPEDSTELSGDTVSQRLEALG
jgi:hypothetical protein